MKTNDETPRTPTLDELLDRVTRQLHAARVSSIYERSGDFVGDMLESLAEANAIRKDGGLPEIPVAEVEAYPGQLTEVD